MFHSTEFRLREYAHVLLRHRLAMFLVTAATVLLGVIPAMLEDPTYASTATMRVKAEAAESPFEDRLPQNEQTRTRDLVSEVEVLQSTGLRALVEQRLGEDAKPFETVSASVVGFSEVIQVRVTASSASSAADAANAYAEVFVDERRQQSVEALVTQSAELRRQGEAAEAQLSAVDGQLSDPAIAPAIAETLRLTRSSLLEQAQGFNIRADELDVEAALREGGTQIVSAARLELTPIAPKPLRTALVALVLGLLAGVGVAVLREMQQDRLTSSDDLAAIDSDVSVLASVPHIEGSSVPPLGKALPAAALEAYRYLRTSLRFRGMRSPIQSLVVTSSMGSEGKTTTAVNLALAMAETGTRVVLIDADIRRPAVHGRIGLVNEVGLTSVLAGDVAFGEAVHYVQPTLVALTAGPPSSSANELLGSDAFGRLVRTVADQCDLLIIDAPPVLPVADALLVARVVDGALVVARVGLVRRREVRALLRRFKEAQLPVVGFVANDTVMGSEYGEYDSYVRSEGPADGVASRLFGALGR